MSEIRSIVITGNGTNCEREMAHANRLGGFDCADIVHISDMLSGDVRLDDYHMLNLAGGFLDGDDLGSAKAAANKYAWAKIASTGEPFRQAILRFIGQEKLILGVCNGFQLLVKLGLLPALEGRYFDQQVTLTHNESGRFEDRWVMLRINPYSPCVFTSGIKSLPLPVRHGEGKLIARDREVRTQLFAKELVAVQYARESDLEPTMDYPANPNGSEEAIAGLCDETGRIFGLMPHPEAFNHRTNHPRWTRDDLPEEGLGVQIFRNAAQYLRRKF